jgi:hypothetical protein
MGRFTKISDSFYEAEQQEPFSLVQVFIPQEGLYTISIADYFIDLNGEEELDELISILQGFKSTGD